MDNALLQIVSNMVKTTPNDTELGKKVRALIHQMAPELIKENKQILKG